MKTLRLCYLALLVCLGLVLPTVFHFIGGTAAGSVFLPLHIPVLLGALVLGAVDGVILGMILPLLSFLLTGMPPIALLPLMMTELSLYGVLCGLFRRLFKSDGIALAISLILGRAVYAAVLAFAFYVLHIEVSPVLTVLTAYIKGIPGIIIQLALIPILCTALRRHAFAKKPAFKRI